MYVEASFILFSLGVIGIANNVKLKRLMGLGLLSSSPSLLLVHSGANALLALTLVTETVLLITLIVLYSLSERIKEEVQKE